MPVSDVMPIDPLTPAEALRAILELAESDDYEGLAATEARTLLKAIAKVAERGFLDAPGSRGG